MGGHGAKKDSEGDISPLVSGLIGKFASLD
jgi:hypothetical protein